jgi:hypothetical protein
MSVVYVSPDYRCRRYVYDRALRNANMHALKYIGLRIHIAVQQGLNLQRRQLVDSTGCRYDHHFNNWIFVDSPRPTLGSSFLSVCVQYLPRDLHNTLRHVRRLPGIALLLFHDIFSQNTICWTTHNLQRTHKFLQGTGRIRPLRLNAPTL